MERAERGRGGGGQVGEMFLFLSMFIERGCSSPVPGFSAPGEGENSLGKGSCDRQAGRMRQVWIPILKVDLLPACPISGPAEISDLCLLICSHFLRMRGVGLVCPSFENLFLSHLIHFLSCGECS